MKEVSYSTVLLLLSAIVPLSPKHPWELLCFSSAPKLRLLRPGKYYLKSLQTKRLQTSLIRTYPRTLLPITSALVSVFYWGEVRVLLCKDFPTKIFSTCWSHSYHLTLRTAPSSFCRALWDRLFPCFFHEKKWQTAEIPCQEATALGVAQLLLTGTSFHTCFGVFGAFLWLFFMHRSS